jgi:predicted NUDIX family phosphoesterase
MLEKVLVVRRDVLEEVGVFQGMCVEVDKYLEKIWSDQNAFFMDRAQAEVDPKYKQIIPYVVMSNNNSILSYVRGGKGGEARLVEKISIGFGGHINPIDEHKSSHKCMREIYNNALRREINEEIEVKATFKDQIVGLINDDSNAVGKVHIGVVHHWILNSQDVKAREQEIAQLKFHSIAELACLKEKMESWSQICYLHLNQRL